MSSDHALALLRQIGDDGQAMLALELETLFSKGMWVITRADELYPRNLRENLKA